MWANLHFKSNLILFLAASCSIARTVAPVITKEVPSSGGELILDGIEIKIPANESQGKLSVQHSALPVKIPKSIPGFRFIMLSQQGIKRSQVYSVKFDFFPTESPVLAYKPLLNALSKDAIIEVFSFDGTNFELLGRGQNGVVRNMPLDLAAFSQGEPADLHIFGVVFTQSQFKQACAKAGGRFNGAYCGPR